MNIEILSQKKIGFRSVVKIANKYLTFIPNEHLIELSKIIIRDKIWDTERREVAGLYHKGYRGEAAWIEIGLNGVYKSMPKVLYYTPFIPVFLFVSVLYHEVGHHYKEKFTHNIKLNEQENYAKKYSTRMLVKAFRLWCFIFLPFKPILDFLKRKFNKKR